MLKVILLNSITIFIILLNFFTTIGYLKFAVNFFKFINDPFTFTFLSLFNGALLWLLFGTSINFTDICRMKSINCLALCHVVAILFTNIAITNTNVVFIYIFKVSEALFSAFLFSFLFENKLSSSAYILLFAILLGLLVAIFNDVFTYSVLNIAIALIATLASALRNLFINTELTGKDPSSIQIYINTSFISVLLFTPFLLINYFVYSNDWLSKQIHFDTLRDLLIGTFFSFISNLTTFYLVTKTQAFSYAFYKIPKQTIIILVFLEYFRNFMSLTQVFGIFITNMSAWLHFQFNIDILQEYVQIKRINLKRKKILTYLMVFCLLGSIVHRVAQKSDYSSLKTYISSEDNRPSVDSSLITSKINYDDNRHLCIKTINDELKDDFRRILPADRIVHFFGISTHSNFGDTLIWAGTLNLIQQIGLQTRILCRQTYEYCVSKRNMDKISKNDTIILHGGGNFGDLWRSQPKFRNKIVEKFPNNKIVFLPQSIFYKDTKVAEYDNKIFETHGNVTITARSNDSYELAKLYFYKSKIDLVSDHAFMVGTIKPAYEAEYDVVVIRRRDREQNFKKSIWLKAFKKLKSNNLTYIDVDWETYSDKRPMLYKSKYKEFGTEVVKYLNEILSAGKLIITDRLHASIFALLMGKPHIMLDNIYKKIYNVRENAFRNKIECESKYLQGFYATDPPEAILKAIEILNTITE